MPQVRTLRVITAAAPGLASFLGLGGLPWLGTYLVGQDLLRRSVRRLAIDQARR